MPDVAERLYRSFVEGDASSAIAVVEEARTAGVGREELFDQVFVPAMAMLGDAWARAEIDEVTFAGASVVADQMSSFVTPQAASSDTGITVVVGCAEGELHSAMRNIIVASLKEAGHRVVDLGVDARPSEFLAKVAETGARIIVVVSEKVGTVAACRRVREMLDADGKGDAVVLAAGGPFDSDPALARETGLNGVAHGGESAVRLVARIADERLAGGSA